jgi:hypothetical protein
MSLARSGIFQPVIHGRLRPVTTQMKKRPLQNMLYLTKAQSQRVSMAKSMSFDDDNDSEDDKSIHEDFSSCV